jgi:hypothetical protein
LPERSRRLLTRAGFFSPSLDGGLPLFELFNPSWRSSSAIRDFKAAISAISSSRDGSAGESGFIESLNRTPIPMSRKIYGPDFAKPPTQPRQKRNIFLFWRRYFPGGLIDSHQCGAGAIVYWARSICRSRRPVLFRQLIATQQSLKARAERDPSQREKPTSLSPPAVLAQTPGFAQQSPLNEPLNRPPRSVLAGTGGPPA